MKMYQWVHGIALVALVILGTMSVLNTLQPGLKAADFTMKLTPIISAIIWCWLTWNIRKRPKAWGLGVGLLLIVMTLLQTYLVYLGRQQSPHDPKLTLGSYLLYQIPIWVGAISCILLRVLPGRRPTEALR